MKEPEIPKSPTPCSKNEPSKVKNYNYKYNKYEHAGYPNPPEHTIPDAATLRDQWRFAIRQYSKWYSHAWGTAILAGLSFFGLGWIIKGSNPIPTSSPQKTPTPTPPSSNSHDLRSK